jgi:hypothetical protein
VGLVLTQRRLGWTTQASAADPAGPLGPVKTSYPVAGACVGHGRAARVSVIDHLRSPALPCAVDWLLARAPPRERCRLGQRSYSRKECLRDLGSPLPGGRTPLGGPNDLR